jgi:hypothetical protein
VETEKVPIYDEIVVLPYNGVHIETSNECQPESLPSKSMTSSSAKSHIESSNIITLPESSYLFTSIVEACEGEIENSNIVSFRENYNDI